MRKRYRAIKAPVTPVIVELPGLEARPKIVVTVSTGDRDPAQPEPRTTRPSVFRYHGGDQRRLATLRMRAHVGVDSTRRIVPCQHS